MAPTSALTHDELRARLRSAIAHLDHVLPGQAPIQDFVHHNTLHGFEHLPFPEALAEAERITGAHGYLPEEQYRAYYREGRISDQDLLQVLDADAGLDAQGELFRVQEQVFRKRDLYRAALVHPIRPIRGAQLHWQMEELQAGQRFQEDVDAESRARLLSAAGSDEATAIADLWSACLERLGLQHYILHPEDLLDLTPDQAERMLSRVVADETGESAGQPVVNRLMATEADELFAALFARIGPELTLRGALQALTGHDLLEEVQPQLIRHLGLYLDQGLAAWHSPDREQGFYTAWRLSAQRDPVWILEGLADLSESLEALPEDSLDAVIIELSWLDLPREQWTAYLQRLALDIPGWSGMFLWRHLHPGYEGQDFPVDMMDYLAVRLVLERLYAQRLCRDLWRIEASLFVLRWYFRENRAEFLVRYHLFNNRLPEYLATLAQRLVNSSREDPVDAAQWQHIAQMIWTWRRSPAADQPQGHTVYRSAWRLFRLSQHLGLCGADLRALDANAIRGLFQCLDSLDTQRRGFIWLRAYEIHYRDELFNALVHNHGRGRWARRDTRPDAQLVFCMDDREEGIRRHLEELNPNIETLGAAGFFGVPIYWRGLDDEKVSALCPVVVTPSHEIHETVRAGHEPGLQRHRARRGWRLRVQDLLFQETRRNLLSSALLVALAAPGALVTLALKTFAPVAFGHRLARLRERFDVLVPTEVAIEAREARPATPEHPRLGFTTPEQADRVEGFLRTVGLADELAPLVVMMGHGSMSQNNPHLAAYDCGACSGRHGGPNARVFAAMANRPEVRAMLAGRGWCIPADTWFLGAEHNTADEAIEWYDSDLIPAALRGAWEELRQALRTASVASARERCRRLASAPRDPAPQQAAHHMRGRSLDFSQARPELGHATNAAAFIGRRAISQGAFWDRRVFLISYDPTKDPEGQVLEAILLAAGPVGAGINLEYYFSTVNNEQYGCGSKVTHNVTGLFGVMDGTAGDLRTGLPRQMIEIHEAMRLQVLVEAKIETLTAIYQRQPPLQQLIGKGWLLLSAKDPDSDAIQVFDPERGFLPWEADAQAPAQVACSTDWFTGHSKPLPPALISQEARHG
ncbi:MAG: DUF2309 domain-containing protein [Xanthomonadaceae bacterium]|nr:DUF2309 domain-containing protein [Xanthomonadaceae bacterium]